MPRYLLMTLAAPMASFGGVAPGERRGSWERPSASALLGLVAAALGVERDDEAAHAALAKSLRFAIRIERPGHLLVDYQTAQTAPNRKGSLFATRREVLASARVETILSRREYRTDILATVSIAAIDSSVSLDEIAQALQRPRFTLYLGRKSCPLSLPLCPRIVEAVDVLDSFTAGDAAEPPAATELRRFYRLHAAPTYVAADQDIAPGASTMRIESRRDQVVHRGRRQFASRVEVIVSVKQVEAEKPR
jgi:CRISPR system Cascade subunit CasD